MSLAVRMELAVIETKITDLQDNLDAISPEHVLFASLTEELRVLKTQFEAQKAKAKELGFI